jgi:hypothetical protein
MKGRILGMGSQGKPVKAPRRSRSRGRLHQSPYFVEQLESRLLLSVPDGIHQVVVGPHIADQTGNKMDQAVDGAGDYDSGHLPYAHVETAVAHFLTRSPLWTNWAMRGIVFAFFARCFCVLYSCLG